MQIPGVQAARRAVHKLYGTYQALSPKRQQIVRGGTVVAVVMTCGVVALVNSFAAGADVSGVVFHDYNGNGKRDNMQVVNPMLAADRGVGGVTVRGFSADGQLCDTRTTNAAGEYTLSMDGCGGNKFRVEFSGLPGGLHTTQIGQDSQSTTQFVAPGGTASLGVYGAGDFCQNNPKLATSCYNAGEYTGANASRGTLFGFPFDSSGTTTPPMTLGSHGQVGATWGLAYRQSAGTLYSAAFMKRHIGFGPAGTGAIYVSPVPASGAGTTTPTLATTIPDTGGDPHPMSDTNCTSRDGQGSSGTSQCWSRDQFSFDAVGKRGLGGMALISDGANPANDALLVVNLNDRKLYKVTNLNAAPARAGYTMPISLPNSGASALPAGNAAGQHQACAGADVRPFAVTVYKGTGYVGMVCSAQTTRSTADLRAYIYSFNPSTMVFATAPMLEFPLNYGRSCSNGNNADGCWQRANWLPWIGAFDDSLVNSGQPPMGDGVKILTAPQPVLSDITFGDNGSMTIGLRDRYGDQMGYRALNSDAGDNRLYVATSTGDILRACLVGGAYTLENAGTCDGKGPGTGGVKAVVSGLPQGPGGYEFYNYDYYANNNETPLYHDEGAQGGLTQVPGFDTVVTSSMNPLSGTTLGIWSGGLRWYNSEDGTKQNAYRLYQSSSSVTTYFGKANGIGDVVALCTAAPIEVGNLVWKDTNGNGVQDAGEPAISGVTVTLENAAGTVLATAVTDASGNYLFSNRAQDENGQIIGSTASRKYGITGLMANTQGFKLLLRTEADYTNASRLQGLDLTTTGVTTNNGNDQNDSNATATNSSVALSAANPAVITFATGEPGANDHTLDFGFGESLSIGNFVWLDSDKNGRVNGGEASMGINGVTVNLYAAAADTNGDGQLSATELAAATPLASRITANDTRPGSTSGRAGYYSFDGLAEGDYFVAIAGSNFASGGTLAGLTDVPVPPGVGDTQDDNANHGVVPAGGTLAAHGVVSPKINLQLGAEPTTTTSKTDDDTNDDSDMTIDFGFWHSYSLGNRVWADKDNSATINPADGPAPGIGGVTVNLLDGEGDVVGTTTTNAGGYYRFDNLAAGTYCVEVAASNFAANGPLYGRVSSAGPGQEADPDQDGDNNDNGVKVADGQAVRACSVTLGPGPSEPTGEADLSGGQGTDDAYANMTVDFGFVGTTSWGDTVYYDYDGDAQQDPDEPGIPGVTVTLTCGGPDGNLATTGDNTTVSMRTDAAGNYLFTGLPPGTCRAAVTTTDVPGLDLTTPGEFTHGVDEDNSYMDADFGFRGAGTLGNQVWVETSGNGRYDPDEGDKPVPGVTIELYQDVDCDGAIGNSDILFAVATTDANGRYQFNNLPVEDNRCAPGANYIVRVTDEANKLVGLQYSAGSEAGADNNSQNPLGYAITLTAAAPNNQTGDFGYYAPPVAPPTPLERIVNTAIVLANTGQALIASVAAAVLLLAGGVGYFVWSRRRGQGGAR